MTNDQEDLLLMLARIVLNQCQQRREQMNKVGIGGEPVDDEFARETARLIDELKPYDDNNAAEPQA